VVTKYFTYCDGVVRIGLLGYNAMVFIDGYKCFGGNYLPDRCIFHKLLIVIRIFNSRKRPTNFLFPT
jgi:hypothetical protein